MKDTYSCSTCAFMREGQIKDRYSHRHGWVTHRGMVCHLHAPYKGMLNPVEPDGICTRWTDKETLDQPLASLCPQTVFIPAASQTATATCKPDADVGSEVEA